MKALKLHRPLVLQKRDIIDISTLSHMVALYQQCPNAVVFKAVWLTAFFGFFRLSNIAQHAIAEFDCNRYFTGGHMVFFQNNKVQLLLKWSKTIQYRNEYRLETLPKLEASHLYPYRALKKLYSPGVNSPLFQIKTTSGWQVLTDSRIRKTLATIKQQMDLPLNFFILSMLSGA